MRKSGKPDLRGANPPYALFKRQRSRLDLRSRCFARVPHRRLGRLQRRDRSKPERLAGRHRGSGGRTFHERRRRALGSRSTARRTIGAPPAAPGCRPKRPARQLARRTSLRMMSRFAGACVRNGTHGSRIDVDGDPSVVRSCAGPQVREMWRNSDPHQHDARSATWRARAPIRVHRMRQSDVDAYAVRVWERLTRDHAGRDAHGKKISPAYAKVSLPSHESAAARGELGWRERQSA